MAVFRRLPDAVDETLHLVRHGFVATEPEMAAVGEDHQARLRQLPALKQQQDTIATLIELSRLGVSASRLKLVFNMVESGVTVAQAFDPLLAFLKLQPIAQANLNCKLGANEIYGRIKGTKTDLAALANDPTDYKDLITRPRAPWRSSHWPRNWPRGAWPVAWFRNSVPALRNWN